MLKVIILFGFLCHNSLFAFDLSGAWRFKTVVNGQKHKYDLIFKASNYGFRSSDSEKISNFYDVMPHRLGSMEVVGIHLMEWQGQQYLAWIFTAPLNKPGVIGHELKQELNIIMSITDDLILLDGETPGSCGGEPCASLSRLSFLRAG